LGPLLFITHIHDVPKCICPKFADDLVAVSVGDDIECITQDLQDAADSVLNWAKTEGTSLNVSKTKDENRDEVSKMINGSVVENVDSYKYLGIMLDSQLDFHKQVEYSVCKAKRASSKVFSLIDGLKGIPVYICITLYKTFVRLHLEYALPVWANINDKDLDLMEKVQLQCIRIVTGAKVHSSASAIEVISGTCPSVFEKENYAVENTSELLLNLVHTLLMNY